MINSDPNIIVHEIVSHIMIRVPRFQLSVTIIVHISIFHTELSYFKDNLQEPEPLGVWYWLCMQSW